MRKSLYLIDSKIRGGEIRTPGLLLPKQIPAFLASYSKQSVWDHIEIKGVVGFARFRVGTFGSVGIPTATNLSTLAFAKAKSRTALRSSAGQLYETDRQLPVRAQFLASVASP